MDLNWTKDDMAETDDFDLFLPLEFSEFDAYHPQRFFPPEPSVISSFVKLGGEKLHFYGTLREDVYELIKSSNPKIMEWLTSNLNVFHMDTSTYTEGLVRYL